MDPFLAGAPRLPATPVGLGLAAVGRPAYLTPGRDADLGDDRSEEALEAAAHAVLDAAYARGVRYLDAARSYGRAEAFLASWLAERVPDDVTVASKWGYRYTGQWRLDAEVHEVKDHGLDALRRQLAETRALLGDALDAYQIHSATLDTGVLADRAVLAELAELADSGVTVGFTTSGPRQADVVRQGLAAEVDGVNPFGLVQATWNLLEPSAGPALAEAAEAGWVVVVKEALANGRLATAEAGPLPEVAARHGTTPDAVAIAAALAEPWSAVALSGAVTPTQLARNTAAVDLRLDGDDLGALGALAEDPEAYWQARSARAWT